jgi:hypothetical protein
MEEVTIVVFWDPAGYPNAEKAKVSALRNTPVRIIWVVGPGVATIDDIWFIGNPQGSITRPVRRPDGSWTAIDTVKGNDTLKYLVKATSSAGVQATSPDPEIENEVQDPPLQN